MTWATIICIVIIIVLLIAALPIELRRELVAIKEEPPRKKSDVLGVYGVRPHTYGKWMRAMMPGVWDRIKWNKKIDAFDALMIKWVLGDSNNGIRVVTREDLRRQLNIKSGKELRAFMEKHHEQLCLSREACNSFICYPAGVLERAILVRNVE